MIKHATFALIALFWVVMNALLWRSEFAHQNGGATVPVALVWEKILRAPDDSSLSINFQGKKLGYVRLRPNVEGTAGLGKIENENEPEGIIRRVSEYTLDLEGSLVAEALARSIRFSGNFAFDTNLRWNRFRTQTMMRPHTWELKGNAAEKAVWFQSSDGESEWIRRFTLDDLRNPQALLREAGSPLLAALIPQTLALGGSTSSTASLALKWEARFEWLTIGRNKVRIYRLEAKLLDRHRIVVLVSRVGEILRIEFPGDLKLINDILYAS
jgi:hypothetical protein